MMGIGPKVISDFGVDVICWEGHMEYFMEECLPNTYRNEKEFDRDRLIERLEYCMRVMHLLHIVHKDIKRENILYSRSICDYVLSDFGLAQVIR
jgi:serine/threonine protein kinase